MRFSSSRLRFHRHSTLFLPLALIPLAAAASRAQKLPPPISLDSGWRLQDASRVAAGGDAVSAPGYRAETWHAATVPGTVLANLVSDGVYPEPLYGTNVRRIPDTLCLTSWWYRKTFAVPRSYAGRHVRLTFQGINHTAEVWVNGHDAGAIRGAFTRGVFDITPYVTPGKAAAVAVRIAPPTRPSGGYSHPSNPIPQTLANGYGPNGGNLEGDTPTFFATEGWDWIPTIPDRDIGIWQGVALSASGPVTIGDPYVVNSPVTAASAAADLTLQATLVNATDRPQTGVLRGEIAGRAFARSVTIPASAAQTVTLSGATVPALHLSHPALWWPNGYGAPHLYRLPLTFTIAGTQSDAQTVTFGVRTIAYGIAGKADALRISVNGVPIMMRGGDWGMDEALKRSPAKRLEAQIKLHRQAGFTMIRNWCGQTTQEDFFALCDRYGILVWNDFWLDDTVNYPIDAQMFLDDERDTLLRFRNHPCIALWCEKNEFPIGPPFEKRMQEVAAELDPQRWLQPCSSSQYGVGDGDYGIEPVTHYFGPFKDVFHTETGAPSIPTLEALRAMMPAGDWDTFDDDWTEHDLCQTGYAAALTARYGPIADTADFVRKAQLADYETYRAMFEGRNARLLAPCSGILLWMTNPAQPSLVWQVYSYDLEPDSAYFGAKHACEMTHIQMTPDGVVQIINNRPEDQDGLTVTASVYDLGGRHIYTQMSRKLTAKATAATKAFTADRPAFVSTTHFVALTLTGSHGDVLSRNFYWRAHSTDEDYRDLQSLPPVTLAVTAARADSAGTTTLHVTLKNPAKTVALMAHLQLRRAKTGERVLPVYYDDNYLSLLPGESRVLDIRAATADLHGGEALLAVDGWNVTAAPWHGRGVAVAPNPEAGLAKPAVIRNIDCGTGWLPGYASDCDVEGGAVACTDDVIDTRGVPMAAPAILYRTERNGECTYTIPAAPGRTYTVALHFAETYFRGKGQRVFSVDINGERKLSDFDIFAAAGGRDRADVQAIPGIRPDARGNIVIRFVKGPADQPKIDGIQIIEEKG